MNWPLKFAPLFCLATGLSGAVAAIENGGRTETFEFNDPNWKEAWFLHANQQPSMNIQKAWSLGYNGMGVTVTTLEDGIEYAHPDIRDNYDPSASYDFNDRDNDPAPRYTYNNENRQGTRIAGLIAASANNSVCSVGIAYKVRIGGIRMLDGDVSDQVEADALIFGGNHADIIVSGWGPDDDGKTIEGPGNLAATAIERIIEQGRNGKGGIIVWASGNGGRRQDDCNCDGYTSSIYTVTIGSVTKDGTKDWFGERCSSILASAYGSGSSEWGMPTTDLSGRCTNGLTGSIGPAGIAAGIVAMALQSNPNLTWRDVQHLIIRTSNSTGLRSDDFVVNGVQRRVSRTFGYGLMDAYELVNQAKSWKSVPEQISCRIVIRPNGVRDRWAVDPGTPQRITVTVENSSCEDGGMLPDRLEHVQLTISTNNMLRYNSFSSSLTSPNGTKSVVLGFRQEYNGYYLYKNWSLTSVHFWDEHPTGEWEIEFERKTWGAYVISPLILSLHGTLQKEWVNPDQEVSATTTQKSYVEVTSQWTDVSQTDSSIDIRAEMAAKYVGCKVSCYWKNLLGSNELCTCEDLDFGVE